ncbi:unnamed protein product [Amoebophrya sp. A25]|nr:unnamed protein product [Amoebophrya sp. A25]|eukprot:GSA25T00009885001.1
MRGRRVWSICAPSWCLLKLVTLVYLHWCIGIFFLLVVGEAFTSEEDVDMHRKFYDLGYRSQMSVFQRRIDQVDGVNWSGWRSSSPGARSLGTAGSKSVGGRECGGASCSLSVTHQQLQAINRPVDREKPARYLASVSPPPRQQPVPSSTSQGESTLILFGHPSEPSCRGLSFLGAKTLCERLRANRFFLEQTAKDENAAQLRSCRRTNSTWVNQRTTTSPLKPRRSFSPLTTSSISDSSSPTEPTSEIVSSSVSRKSSKERSRPTSSSLQRSLVGIDELIREALERRQHSSRLDFESVVADVRKDFPNTERNVLAHRLLKRLVTD